jgi:hypothetical protein
MSPAGNLHVVLADRRLAALIAALVVAAIAMIVVGGKFGGPQGYISSVWLEIGAALLLVAPLVYLERLLGDQIEDVRDDLKQLRAEAQSVAIPYERARKERPSGHSEKGGPDHPCSFQPRPNCFLSNRHQPFNRDRILDERPVKDERLELIACVRETVCGAQEAAGTGGKRNNGDGSFVRSFESDDVLIDGAYFEKGQARGTCRPTNREVDPAEASRPSTLARRGPSRGFFLFRPTACR